MGPELLLAQGEGYVDGAGYGAAYHRVVADAEEAHHLDVCGYAAGAGELGVGVHAAHGVGHTVGGGAGGHVVGMEGTAGATTGGYAEVGLTGEDALLLVRAGYGVLEAGGVGGVTGDGYIHVLLPQYGYAFADVVGTVAVDLGAGTVAVGLAAYDAELAGEVVELGLHIGEAVDAADDHGSVLAQAAEDAAEGLAAYLVSHLGDLDGAFGSSE